MPKKQLSRLLAVTAIILGTFITAGCETAQVKDIAKDIAKDLLKDRSEKQTVEKKKTLSEYLLAENYEAGMALLDKLYTEYPSSSIAEARFVGSIHRAVGDLLLDNDKQLQQFIEWNPNQTSMKFFESFYFLRRGTNARGERYTVDTAKSKLDLMKIEMKKSIAGFEEVLAIHPESYLAYTYIGVIYSYIGTRAKSDIEFRKALVRSPASYTAWSNFLWYNHPRWGGSYVGVTRLIEEMGYQVRENPRLVSLRGVINADKADAALLKGKLKDAETLVFMAMEYGSYWRYTSVVDSLHRKIQESGDREAACRISRKVVQYEPKNQHHRNLVESC